MNEATIKANPTATRLSTKVIDFESSSVENSSAVNGFVWLIELQLWLAISYD